MKNILTFISIIIIGVIGVGAASDSVCNPTTNGGQRALYFPRGHADVVCNSTGVYDHHYKPCETLPNIRCIGTPSQQELGKYQWTCSTKKKISGYDAYMAVLDDYKTIYVRLRPHVDMSPGSWVMCTVFVCSLALCLCIADKGDGGGGTFIYWDAGEDDGYMSTNIS